MSFCLLFLPLPTASSSSSFFEEHRKQLWTNLRGIIYVQISCLAVSLFQIAPHSLVDISYIYLMLFIFCCGAFFQPFLVPHLFSVILLGQNNFFVGCNLFTVHVLNKTKLLGLSPRANYTDRATAACRRS
jgi:hypothetical protein